MNLKGKKIGLTLGSNAEHLLNIVLEDAGLTQKDVEIVALEQADILSVLQTGDIDAAAVWEPRISQTKEYAFRLADGEGTYDKDGKQLSSVPYGNTDTLANTGAKYTVYIVASVLAIFAAATIIIANK